MILPILQCGAASRRGSCGAAGIRTPGQRLKNTNLTQFAPDVIAGLYLSLFMYSGEYSTIR
jgi:hypothetical protein